MNHLQGYTEHDYLPLKEQTSTSPPSPPLPPPAPPLPSNSTPNPTSPKASIRLKTRSPPPSLNFSPPATLPSLSPPTGTYFFYGTLQSPSLLRDILSLPTLPTLQQACIRGWKTRMWGVYPALIPAAWDQSSIVAGAAFEILDPEAAGKLAEFEGASYRVEGMEVLVGEDGSEGKVKGWGFVFCGREGDLDDGGFDLGKWEGRVGRRG